MCNPMVNENSGVTRRVTTGDCGAIGEMAEIICYGEFLLVGVVSRLEEEYQFYETERNVLVQDISEGRLDSSRK